MDPFTSEAHTILLSHVDQELHRNKPQNLHRHIAACEILFFAFLVSQKIWSLWRLGVSKFQNLAYLNFADRDVWRHGQRFEAHW